MAHIKKIILGSAAFLIVIFTCYIMSELMLGAVPDVPWNTPRNWLADPQVGPWNKTNYQDTYATSEFSHNIRWNSFGMRDKERQLAKNPGAFRTAFLGDSFTEGLEVSDAENKGPEYPSVRLKAWGVKTQTPILDLNEVFLKRMAASGTKAAERYYPKNGHFNPLGHLWTAEAIRDFLLDHNMINQT